MTDVVLHVLKLLGVFRIARWMTRGALRILCYHGIWLERGAHFGDKLFMQADKFAGRLGMLRAQGYSVLRLGPAVEQLRAGTLPPAPVVITIDDGWYGTAAQAVPALTRSGIPATVYVTTYYAERQVPVLNVAVRYMVERARIPVLKGREVHPDADGDFPLTGEAAQAAAIGYWSDFIDRLPQMADRLACAARFGKVVGVDFAAVAATRGLHLMTLDEVGAADRAGIDIQLHTHRHHFPVDDAARLEREIAENRAVLARVCSGSLDHFCYPTGRYAKAGWPTLEKLGIKSATTLLPGFNYPDTPRYELRRFADGQTTSDIRFEAEMAGVFELLRQPKQMLRSAFGRHRPATTTAPGAASPA
jgi:peptidoglycan/xylan/chitin deacetylase (PgdA/CDA1 family)